MTDIDLNFMENIAKIYFSEIEFINERYSDYTYQTSENSALKMMILDDINVYLNLPSYNNGIIQNYNYDNSIFILCKSLYNNIRSNVLFMIYPFYDKTTNKSSFHIAYTINENYDSLTRQKDVELELNENNKIKLINNKLYLENNNLILNFDPISSGDIIYCKFKNNLNNLVNSLDINKRNELINSIQDYVVYNSNNFLIDNETSFTPSNDYFVYDFNNLNEFFIENNVINNFYILFKSKVNVNFKFYLFINYKDYEYIRIYFDGIEQIVSYTLNNDIFEFPFPSGLFYNSNSIENGQYYLNILTYKLPFYIYLITTNYDLRLSLYENNNDYYIYYTTDLLNNLFPQYGKFKKLKSNELPEISNDSIPVYYYNSEYNPKNSPILKMLNSSIKCNYINNNELFSLYLQKNLSVDNNSNNIYIDSNNNLYMELNQKYIIFTSKNIIKLQYFNYFLHYSMNNIIHKCPIKNYTENYNYAEIDLPLLCILKKPKVILSDLNKEILIEQNELGYVDDYEDMQLYKYNENFYKPYNEENPTELIAKSSDYEVPQKSNNFFEDLKDLENFTLILYFIFQGIDKDYFDKDYFIDEPENIGFNSLIIYNNNDIKYIKWINGYNIIVEFNNIIKMDNYIIFRYNNIDYITLDKNNTITFNKNEFYETFPCNCNIENFNDEDYIFEFEYEALYTYTKIEEDNPFFTFFIGNNSIKLNDTIFDVNTIYNEYLENIENYLEIENNNKKLYTLKECYENQNNFLNIYISIFICYRYRYKNNENSTALIKHYYKSLLNYIPFRDNNNNSDLNAGIVEKIFLNNNEENPFKCEYESINNNNENENEFFIKFEKINDNKYLINLNDLELDTTDIITLNNLSINYNDENFIENYIENNGCNIYQVKTFIGKNENNENIYINIPLDFINKNDINLENIDIELIKIKSYPYGKI